MAEKRGNTVKLGFDFNTSGVLEVYMDQWYRVTPNEFRSFDGPRRITSPVRNLLGRDDPNMETVNYHGPVYLYKTTVEVAQQGLATVVRDLSKHTKF